MPSTAAQMHDQADRIYQLIFAYAGQIGREQDKDRLLNLIAAMARDLVGADRCSIWLVDQHKCELYTRVADGVQEIRLPVGTGLVGRCVETGEPSVVNSPASDPRFSSQTDRITGYRTQSILTVPMRNTENKVMGACQVLNKPDGFAPSDVDIISFAASFSAQAIENQQLQRERESARQLRHELEIAREVQQRLLPPSPVIDNLDCAALCRPAIEVGGDYYNYWTVSSGKVVIALGDVSGKGISAALLMASLQGWLHGLVCHTSNCACDGAINIPDLCAELNRIVYNNTTEDRYSTLFFAQWDSAKETLNYVTAGQPAPFFYRPTAKPGERILRLTEGGLPIGLMAHANYQQGTISFGPEDWLLCFSDGISEAMNSLEQEWGEANILETLQKSADVTANAVAERIMQAALDFAGTAPQHDDMTIVAIRPRSCSPKT